MGRTASAGSDIDGQGQGFGSSVSMNAAGDRVAIASINSALHLQVSL